MNEVKWALNIIKQKLKNADQQNINYQKFNIAEMEAILGVFSKSESDYAALKQKLDAMGPFIQLHDLKALLRFNETSEDGECYDISDDAMSRLVELGLVAKERGKMRIITSFGMWVVAREDGEKIGSLKTQRDRDLAFQQRIAQLRSGTHDTADKAG